MEGDRGPIRQFEDLHVWQKARDLSAAVYRATGSAGFRQDYALRDQMRRAAVSVLSNIAEGYERGGNVEFRQFLSQAKGSAGEVRAQLYVALDAGLLDQPQFSALHALAAETSRLLAGLMKYLSTSDYRGSKLRTLREDVSPFEL